MFQTEVIEKIKTHMLCSIFFPENRSAYEIMWKNIADPETPQITIYHGACALHAVYLGLDKHSEYVILITFPRQQ